MAKFYIDDSGLLYAENSALASTAVNTTDRCRLNLNDAPALSTMSTWLINSIRFSYQGYIDPSGPAVNSGTASVIAGISPEDMASPYPKDLDDFQEIKGWPLKNGYRNFYRENTPQKNSISWTHTWKPSRGNHLALNRLQDILLTFSSESGDWVGMLEIYVCASRGK